MSPRFRFFLPLGGVAGMCLVGCLAGAQAAALESGAVSSRPFSSDTNAAAAAADWIRIDAAARPGIASTGWWHTYHDAQLDRLQELGRQGNWSLKAAAARLDQARAVLQQSRADFFPTGGSTPSTQRLRTSANQFDRGQAAGVSHTYSSFALPLEASWEADLWGRVRRQVRASRERLAAAEWDERAARLSLESEITSTYWTWQGAVVEHRLLTRTVQAYEKSLELIRNRRQGGIVSDLDVARAEAQLKGAATELPGLRLKQAHAAHALAVLCGVEPGALVLEEPAELPAPIHPAPDGAASEWLLLRPDVAAAVSRMAAANADAGVARASFYPRLMLRGTAGLASIDAGSLFDWPSRFWAVGPSLELPFFDLKRKRARLRIAESVYRENVAAYRQHLLNAFQEVEDHLAAARLLAEQHALQKAALTAASKVRELAENRYRAGLITYLEVATAQTEALSRERAVVLSNLESLKTSVGLIRALGGPNVKP